MSQSVNKDNLHHAYLLETERDEGLRIVRALMDELGILTKGNPDYYEYIFDVFLLEHAHLLRTRQSFRGADGAKKIFLVSFNTILSEAQNALLKTLEEPTEGTHFFFITKTRAQLFPTVLSRMQLFGGGDETIDVATAPAGPGEKFLSATIAERMKIITPMTKAKVDEKSEAKEEARHFLNQIERALYKYMKAGEGGEDKELPSKIAHALNVVLIAKHALSQRSPSTKLLLEHLALTAPIL